MKKEGVVYKALYLTGFMVGVWGIHGPFFLVEVFSVNRSNLPRYH